MKKIFPTCLMKKRPPLRPVGSWHTMVALKVKLFFFHSVVWHFLTFLNCNAIDSSFLFLFFFFHLKFKSGFQIISTRKLKNVGSPFHRWRGVGCYNLPMMTWILPFAVTRCHLRSWNQMFVNNVSLYSELSCWKHFTWFDVSLRY